MNINVGKEVAALKRMTVDDLRQKYAEVFQETASACPSWSEALKLGVAFCQGCGVLAKPEIFSRIVGRRS